MLARRSWGTRELSELIGEAIIHDERKKQLAEEKARQDKLDKITALRAEADKLEESL